MTTGFQVDLPAIDRLIRTLEEGAERVREANAELGGYGSVDELGDAGGLAGRIEGRYERLEVLGNESLAEAAQRFAAKWRYGLDKLDEAAEAILDRLHDTRRTYQAVDDACRRLFDEMPVRLVGGNAVAAAGGIADVLGGQS